MTDLYPGLVVTHPESKIVQQDPLTATSFHCAVSGVTLRWYINGTIVWKYTHPNGNVTYSPTLALGSPPYNLSSHLYIPRVLKFDNTSIVCQAFGTNGTNEISNTADLAVLKGKCTLAFFYYYYFFMCMH